MATVFDVLARDHQEVKRLLTKLSAGRTMAGGASENELLLRTRLAKLLARGESRHEEVEEKFVWPVVRDRVVDGDVLADEASAQGQTAREVLSRLDKLDAGEAAFEDLLAMFRLALLQHLEFEEMRVWPALTLALTTAEAEGLGVQLAAAKRTASAQSGG